MAVVPGCWLSRQGERVCVFPCGELFSEMLQVFPAYFGDAESFFILLEGGELPSSCVYQGGMSRVRDAVCICPYSVHAACVALVFKGSCLQEDVPCVVPGGWPVGGDDKQVVSVPGVAQPYRESQVVAYGEADVPSFVVEDAPAASGGEVFRLVAHAEQVAFVIMAGAAVRGDEEGAVEDGLAFPADEAAGQCRVELRGPLLQLAHGAAFHGFGQKAVVRAEAGREHFGENHEVCFPLHLLQQGGCLEQAGGFDFSGDVELCEADAHVRCPLFGNSRDVSR